jgi:hypothetical protein
MLKKINQHISWLQETIQLLNDLKEPLVKAPLKEQGLVRSEAEVRYALAHLAESGLDRKTLLWFLYE